MTAPSIRTEIRRGNRVESIHEAAAAECPAGGAPEPLGRAGARFFLRSLAKPMQTLVLFESGVV
ncbi:MAG: asparaginase, partial [Planctomycetes bacterium]|nr:asparaginase [Planctomycetota bacterium]